MTYRVENYTSQERRPRCDEQTAGQIRQVQPYFRQKAALLVLRSAIESLERSHARKASNAFAELSILRTDDAPHDLHRHLCVPAGVLPFFFIFAPQEAHFGLFKPSSSPSATICSKKPA